MTERNMLSQEQLAAVECDIEKFLERINKRVNENLDEEHFSYPFLNSIVHDLADGFIQDVLSEGPPEALLNMQRLTFQALLAVYEMGFDGHVVFKTPCTADHSK
jgi:uncharacterized FlaG/YvyC family protein